MTGDSGYGDGGDCPRLLFIDHEFHRKTRSADFFVRLLKKSFPVEECHYRHYYETGSREAMVRNDMAVIWEFPLGRKDFFHCGKRNVFVPMYDNEWGSRWQWRRIAWSGMGVISFCSKVAKHARDCGVENLLEVKYFPDANELGLPVKHGDPRKVFFWEREESTAKLVRETFPRELGYEITVKPRDEFWERGKYLDAVSECGVVVAPRRREGIGMAFLEAMAMGKCVAGYDDATMNEYIVDGENGILMHERGGANPVDAGSVERIHVNVLRGNAKFAEQWRRDKERIKEFLRGQPVCAPDVAAMMKISLAYYPYLAEAALMRARSKFL